MRRFHEHAAGMQTHVRTRSTLNYAQTVCVPSYPAGITTEGENERERIRDTKAAK